MVMPFTRYDEVLAEIKRQHREIKVQLDRQTMQIRPAVEDDAYGRAQAWHLANMNNQLEFWNALKRLIDQVEALKDQEALKPELIKALSETTKLLNGTLGIQQYAEVANEMQGKPSVGLKAVGAAMFVTGILASIASIVGAVMLVELAPVSFACIIGGALLGSLLYAGGVLILDKAVKRTGISKAMMDVHTMFNSTRCLRGDSTNDAEPGDTIQMAVTG